MKLKIILIACLALTSGMLMGAADWKLISDDKAKRVFLDVESIRTDDMTIVKFWLKMEFNPLMDGKVAKNLQSWELLCIRKQQRLTAASEYGPVGNMIASGDYKNGEFEEIRPESLMDSLWQVLCSKMK